MRDLHKKVLYLLKQYENWEINHIMREKNIIADKLSKQGRKKGK